MEKEYLKKYLAINGNKDSLLPYEQITLLNPGDKGNNFNIREKFNSTSDEELEVTEQLHPSSYGSGEESSEGEVEASESMLCTVQLTLMSSRYPIVSLKDAANPRILKSIFTV